MKNCIFIFLASILLSSCSFYSPAVINAPKYTEPHQANIGFAIGTTADLNLSFNPVEHVSLIGNVSYAGEIQNENDALSQDEREFNYSRHQLEGAVGYYYNLGSNIQHDFHIGYGFGKTADYFGLDFFDEAISSDLSNVFIQSSMIFGEQEANDVNFLLSVKYNRLSFSNISYNIDQPSNPNEFIALPTTRDYWAAQFGAGLTTNINEVVNVFVQAQLIISDSPLDGDFIIRPIGGYAGIRINLQEAFRQ